MTTFTRDYYCEQGSSSDLGVLFDEVKSNGLIKYILRFKTALLDYYRLDPFKNYNINRKISK